MVVVGLEGLPTSLINEILLKLETETLCSVACVSRALRFAVSEALSLSSSLNLSVNFLQFFLFPIFSFFFSENFFWVIPLLGPLPELLLRF